MNEFYNLEVDFDISLSSPATYIIRLANVCESIQAYSYEEVWV